MVNAFNQLHHGTPLSHPSGLGGVLSKVGFNGGGRVERGNVLCTTELGLRCITRKGTTSNISVNGEGGGKQGDVFERRLLLLPKVVLDSAVDALD